MMDRPTFVTLAAIIVTIDLVPYRLVKVTQTKVKILVWTNHVTTYQWLSARLQYLQCISNGDTTVLH